MIYLWFKKLRQEQRDTQEILAEEIRAIHDASKAAQQKQGEIGSVIAHAIEQAGASVPDYEKSQRCKEYRLQRGSFWTTVLGVVFAGLAAGGAWYYAAIAKCQLGQTIEATNQARRSADVAACALKENQRQFRETSTSNQDQFTETLREIQAQTSAQKKTAKSSSDAVQVAKDSIYVEQRPWVGIQQINRATLPPNTVAFNPGSDLKPQTLIIVAHNTGRTPALRWRMYCCESVDQIFFSPIPPDYDTLHERSTQQLSPDLKSYTAAHPDQAAAIHQRQIEMRNDLEAYQAAENQETIVPDGYRQLDISVVRSDDHQHHFKIGKMVYWDTIDPSKMHVTKFCLWQLGNSPFMVCTFGQDMD